MLTCACLFTQISLPSSAFFLCAVNRPSTDPDSPRWGRRTRSGLGAAVGRSYRAIRPAFASRRLRKVGSPRVGPSEFPPEICVRPIRTRGDPEEDKRKVASRAHGRERERGRVRGRRERERVWRKKRKERLSEKLRKRERMSFFLLKYLYLFH